MTPNTKLPPLDARHFEILAEVARAERSLREITRSHINQDAIRRCRHGDTSAAVSTLVDRGWLSEHQLPHSHSSETKFSRLRMTATGWAAIGQRPPMHLEDVK